MAQFAILFNLMTGLFFTLVTVNMLQKARKIAGYDPYQAESGAIEIASAHKGGFDELLLKTKNNKIIKIVKRKRVVEPVKVPYLDSIEALVMAHWVF